jgi:hypothetical protein
MMIKHVTHRLVLALVFALLANSAGKAIAQSTAPPPPAPTSVTGTDPEPQISYTDLFLVFLGAVIK